LFGLSGGKSKQKYFTGGKSKKIFTGGKQKMVYIIEGKQLLTHYFFRRAQQKFHAQNGHFLFHVLENEK